MAVLPITEAGVNDFRGAPAETDIDQIVFETPGNFATAIFATGQFGAGLISSAVTITGDFFVNIIDIRLASPGTFSAAGWQFENWISGDDRVVIGSTGGNDNITGSIRDDLITNGGGIDHIDAGAGNDTIQINAAIGAGTTIEGGTQSGGFDEVTLFRDGTTDLRPATITGVEQFHFLGNGQTAILGQNQIGAGGFGRVAAESENSASLVVRGDDIDLTGIIFDQWGSDESVILEGSSSILNTLVGSPVNDTIRGSLNSTDNMTGGDGADTMKGGGGNDNFFYRNDGETGFGEILNGGAGTDQIRLVDAGLNTFTFVTLALLAQHGDGSVSAVEAVEAFRASLTQKPRERLPLDWASGMHNLGRALMMLGIEKQDSSYFEQAITAFKGALEVRTRESFPLQWAGTQQNIGAAFGLLGEARNDLTMMAEGAEASRMAAEALSQLQSRGSWVEAVTQYATILIATSMKTNQPEPALQAKRYLATAIAKVDAAKQPPVEAFSRKMADSDRTLARIKTGQAP